MPGGVPYETHWLTAHRTLIRIENMDTKHLYNTYKLLKSKPTLRQESLPFLEKELIARGVLQPKDTKTTYEPVRSKTMADATNRTKRILDKSKNNSKFIEKILQEQNDLIAELDGGLDVLFDLILDAETIMTDDVMDDNLGISTMKNELGKMMKQITAWKEKQNNALLDT